VLATRLRRRHRLPSCGSMRSAASDPPIVLPSESDSNLPGAWLPGTRSWQVAACDFNRHDHTTAVLCLQLRFRLNLSR